MAQQTAVEWLFLHLYEKFEMKGDGREMDKILEQAKAMEKEQIMNAFGVGCQVEATRLIGYHGMAEQYYNETYNK